MIQRPLTNSRLRKALKKVTAPQTGWLDLFPAILGRVDGTVLTGVNGVVYVRNILNGQVLTVYNTAVPNIPSLQVEVGRRVDQPGLWQVKGTIESFDVPASSSSGSTVPDHHTQHEFPNLDTVWVDRKQLVQLTVLVKDASNFIVQVLGGMAGNIKVNSQPMDLSSYVVTAGAKFVGIETDEDGVLTIQEGAAFDAPAIATKDDLPMPPAGQFTLAWVLFYEAQAQLSNSDILIPMPAFFNPMGYSAVDHEHEVSTSEVVMEDGVTFPPVPITTEDGDDWIYSD